MTERTDAATRRAAAAEIEQAVKTGKLVDPRALLWCRLFFAFEENDEKDREKYMRALMAVADFVEDELGDRDLGHHFFRLASNLGDLDRGAIPKLLEATPTGTRPPYPAEVWLRRSKIVVALEMLNARGQSFEEAAKRLAKIIRLPTGGRSNSSSPGAQILSWRADLKAGKIPHEGGDPYAYNSAFARELAAAPRGNVEAVLDGLPRHSDTEPLV